MSLKLGGTKRLADIVCCASASKNALRRGNGVQNVETVGTNRCRRECSGLPCFCISIWSWKNSISLKINSTDARKSEICFDAHWSVSQYQTWSLHSVPWTAQETLFHQRYVEAQFLPRHREQTRSAESVLWIQSEHPVYGIVTGNWSKARYENHGQRGMKWILCSLTL